MGRTVCYYVWQTLFWFLVRLPSVCFSTDQHGGLSCWAYSHGLLSLLNGFPYTALLSFRWVACLS